MSSSPRVAAEGQEVLELSVEETNVLRAKLGLKPLRLSSKSDGNANGSISLPTSIQSPTRQEAKIPLDENPDGSAEELSLSIAESNALRAKLNLPPLRIQSTTDDDDENEAATKGRKATEAIHAPASNTGQEKEVRERLEQNRLKREVEAGIQKMRSELDEKDEEGDDGFMSWAAKMRMKADNQTKAKSKIRKSKKAKKKKVGNRMSIPSDGEEEEGEKSYTEKNLKDQNLKVNHSTADFEVGSTTILTLADQPILNEKDDENDDNDEGINELENVNMTEHKTVKDNLKKKRMVEMGMGHAGGYAGYDDDEFEELGGSQMSLRENGNGRTNDQGKGKGAKGFKLGSLAEMNVQSQNKKEGSDLFASETGKAISIDDAPLSVYENEQMDFMTYEEEKEQEGKKTVHLSEKEKKRLKKNEKKMFKKLKKQRKKEKKRRHRRSDDDDDDSEKDGEGETYRENADNIEKSETNLPDEVEASAPVLDRKGRSTKNRKRRRESDSSDEDGGGKDIIQVKETNKHDSFQEKSKDATMNIEVDGDEDNDDKKYLREEDDEALIQQKRKEKYNQIMEKANSRTNKVFSETNKNSGSSTANISRFSEEKVTSSSADKNTGHLEEEDDAFLTVALEKARRLRRLRELNAKSSASDKDNGTDVAALASNSKSKGASAVVQAVKSLQEMSDRAVDEKSAANEGSKITFELDATREFTRALRARAAQVVRSDSSSRSKSGITVGTTPKHKTLSAKENQKEDTNFMDVDNHDKEKSNNSGELEVRSIAEESLEKLADQIKDDKNELDGFGSTASTVPVGRGLSSVLSMLKHTGEITGKHAGKEELRGRAKDKRTYEDYESLDLKKVVKIDATGLSGPVHEKDIEFANREIKLEYRDEHGRLLTRKEAYRNLCYQFHGHGSSKKNEERKLKQIERERAERSIASKQAINAGSGRAGTLGALKATQRATGKAFVVHKI